MDTEAAFSDIMDAIARLRIAFIKHGMSAPVSIELGNVRDKNALMYCILPRDMVLVDMRMGEIAEHVCNIQGIEVRMPGEWRADRGGRKHFV